MAIIAIDFDGTIVEDRFPEIGNMIPGAKENINKLYSEGYEIIIWSCRNGINKAKAIEWLVKTGIKFHRFNESSYNNLKAHKFKDTRKVFADMYIDDRQPTPLPEWSELYDIIHEKLPRYADIVALEGFL